MGAWRTGFVFYLGADPGAAAQFASAAPTWWRRFMPGLYVSVKGDRVKAFCNDWSPQPTRPVFRGHVVTDASGTRIEGTLSWALQKFVLLTDLFFACVCVYGVDVAARDGDRGSALLLAGCTVVSLAFAGQARWSERREREAHEQELRDGLAEILNY